MARPCYMVYTQLWETQCERSDTDRDLEIDLVGFSFRSVGVALHHVKSDRIDQKTRAKYYVYLYIYIYTQHSVV